MSVHSSRNKLSVPVSLSTVVIMFFLLMTVISPGKTVAENTDNRIISPVAKSETSKQLPQMEKNSNRHPSQLKNSRQLNSYRYMYPPSTTHRLHQQHGYQQSNIYTYPLSPYKNIPWGLHTGGYGRLNSFPGKSQYRNTIKNELNNDTQDLNIVGAFSEGLAPVEKDGKFGFINVQGDIEIEPRFDSVTPFYSGRSWARKGGLWFFINHQGEIIDNP